MWSDSILGVFRLQLSTWNSSLAANPARRLTLKEEPLEGASDSVQPADSSLEKHKADSQISSKNIYFPHHYLQSYHVCFTPHGASSVQTFSHLSIHHVPFFKPWIPPKSAVSIKLWHRTQRFKDKNDKTLVKLFFFFYLCCHQNLTETIKIHLF